MKRETIALEHRRLDVLIDDNLIYLNMFGEYTDNDAISMTKYLENFFSETGEPTTRVWDTTNLSKDGFKLTTQSIDKFTN